MRILASLWPTNIYSLLATTVIGLAAVLEPWSPGRWSMKNTVKNSTRFRLKHKNLSFYFKILRI
jgi:hypothetical protein